MSFDKIKRFINEKIFHKKDQKLLGPSTEYSMEEYDGKIDFSPIFTYIENEKYVKNLHVSFGELNLKTRKKLIKRIEDREKGNINFTHDDFPLIEGTFSKESFISVRRKNVKMNKIGQTIVTRNQYIDISTRRKSKNTNYGDLQYKEYKKNDEVEDLFEFDEENELYYRNIKKNRNYIYRISIIWE